MSNTPTREQVLAARTWIELAASLGLHSRNDRAMAKVKAFVREHYPDSSVARPRRSGQFTDEEFAAIVARVGSTRALLVECGYRVAGGGYTMVNDRIKRLGLTTDHFHGQGHMRGKKSPNARATEYYLVHHGPPINSHSLKMRLVRENIKEHRCEHCKRSEWEAEPIPIELDHINGDKLDNRLENLRILCPNCHARTPTYGVRNRGRHGGDRTHKAPRF